MCPVLFSAFTDDLDGERIESISNFKDSTKYGRNVNLLKSRAVDLQTGAGEARQIGQDVEIDRAGVRFHKTKW